MGEIGHSKGGRIEPFFAVAQGFFKRLNALADRFHLVHQGIGRLLVPFEGSDLVRHGLAPVPEFFHFREKVSPFPFQLEEAVPVDVLAARPKAGANLFGLVSEEAEIEHEREPI
jgi:hypothetical protein